MVKSLKVIVKAFFEAGAKYTIAQPRSEKPLFRVSYYDPSATASLFLTMCYFCLDFLALAPQIRSIVPAQQIITTSTSVQNDFNQCYIHLVKMMC